MSKKRAFVRYSKQGKVVPGSLILTAGSYPNGPSTWKEVPADLCCETPTSTSDCCPASLAERSPAPALVSIHRENPADIGLVDVSCRFPSTIVTLTNGTKVDLNWAQAVLGDGTIIYEAYELSDYCVEEPLPINGWWVAMRPNSTDPSQLDVVGELRMTAQFWDWWYDWTYHPTTNSVQFISYSYPYPLNDAASYITTLTVASNGTITAVDEDHDYGDTWGQLWMDITGDEFMPEGFNVYYPLYNALDDWYGMLDGPEKGWLYIKNSGSLTIDGFDTFVGFNLFTGMTRIVESWNLYDAAGVTNFPTRASGEVIAGTINYGTAHPQGFLLALNRNVICPPPAPGFLDLSDTCQATGLWSPFWTDITKAAIIDFRQQYNPYALLSTSGSISAGLWPYAGLNWADSSLYMWINDSWSQEARLMTYYRLSLNSTAPSETKDLLIPDYRWSELDGSWDFPTDKGMFLMARTRANSSYPPFETNILCSWLKVDEKPQVLKTIGMYPYSFQGNKIYDPFYGVANGLMVGLTIDTFTNKILQ